MESFDQSLKYLLQHEPADFIRFGLADPTVQILTSIPSGLPARARDVDGAYLIVRGDPHVQTTDIPDANKQVVHVEFHRRHQALEDLALDVGEAQIRIFRRERRMVLSLVWDLYGDPDAPVLGERAFQFGQTGSRCVYQRVNLRGMGAEELLSRGPPALWPLVALTRDGRSEAVIVRARDAIEARTTWSSSERADHLAVLWFVAEAEGLPAKMMRAYFTEKRLMESELYKSIFSRGKTEGEASARAELLLQLLIHRLGSVDPVVRDCIQTTADVASLKAWYNEALFASEVDVVRRLVEKIRSAALP